METHIPRHLINQILEQAQRSPGKEICGLMSSQNQQPVTCYPVANIAVDPAHRFLMDPKQQIDIMREMRQRGEDLFAIYHSHPDTPPIPSSQDLEQANYPETLYLVISLAMTGTLQLNGFRIQANSATPVDIIAN